MEIAGSVALITGGASGLGAATALQLAEAGAQVVLADEINRATPRSQSGLLEAMEEKQITVDGETHFLPKPFLVLATQNPIELAGTFPLPEAQLDRFLLKVKLGYPSWEEDHLNWDFQSASRPGRRPYSLTTRAFHAA